MSSNNSRSYERDRSRDGKPARGRKGGQKARPDEPEGMDGMEDARADDSEPEPISEALEALADDAIEYGLSQLGETGSLAVTLFAENEKGARDMLSFEEDDNVEECLNEARGRVAATAQGKKRLEGFSGRPVRYAIAYAGSIEAPDAPRRGYLPALIVEYGEEGLSSGYSAYLLYRKPGKKDFTWTDARAAGETELLV